MSDDPSALILGALSNLKAPQLKRLNADTWDRFLPEWQHYQATAPTPLPLKVCLSSKIVPLLTWQLADGEKWGDIDDARVEALILQCISPQTRVEALDQFARIQFPKSGTLVEAITQYCIQYTALLSRLSKSVAPTKKTLISQFLKRLPSSLATLEDFLDCEPHDSFHDICKKAIQWCQDAQRLRLINFGSSNKPGNSSSGGTGKRRHKNRRNNSSSNADESPTNENPTSTPDSKPSTAERHAHLTCHYCNVKGHIQPNCPKKQHGSGDNSGSNRSGGGDNSGSHRYNFRSRDSDKSVNNVQPATGNEPFDLSQSKPSCNNVSSETQLSPSLSIALFDLVPFTQPSSDDPVTAKVSVPALLDSGSSFNLISETALRSLPPAFVSCAPSHVNMVGADGKSPLVSHMTAELCLQVSTTFDQPVCLFTTFHVVPELSHDCIVGHSFFHENNLWSLLEVVASSTESPMPVSAPQFRTPAWDPSADDLPSEPLKEIPIDSPTLIRRLEELRTEFSDIFGVSDRPCNLPPADFQVPDSFNLRPAKPRRLSPIVADKVDHLLKEYLRLGIIEPSTSTTTSPLHVALKPSGDLRLTVDYRDANKQLSDIPFAALNTELIVEQLQGKKFYGRLDLWSGFYQLLLAPHLRDYFAFVCLFGNFRFNRLPQGLRISPSIFHTKILHAFQGLAGCHVYLDDILLCADTEAEFLALVRAVFLRCRSLNLRLHPEKCVLGLQSLHALGFLVTSTGYTIPPAKRAKLTDLSTPTTTGQVRTFLGLANYFRKFVPNFAQIAVPLYKLTAKGTTFTWTDTHQHSFDTLKDVCATVPMLTFPTRSGFLHLYTDASQIGIGAILLEAPSAAPVLTYDPARHRIIAFLSKAFTPVESRWSVIEQELFAVFYSIKMWESYLLGCTFTVYTDHSNLVYLHNTSNSKLERYRLALQTFDFTVVHIPGRTNVVADCLSRLPPVSSTDSSTPSVNVVSSAPAITRAHFDKVHNSLVGHLGVAQTLARLRDAGFTVTSTDAVQIRSWIRSCALCQKVRMPKTPVTRDPRTTLTSTAWTKITIDLVGPLPASADTNYTYILSVIDNFTRYTELRPLLNSDAISTATALLDVVSRYGFFQTLASDRGSNFTSAVITCLCQQLGINQLLSVPYSPQSQGIVERRHQDIMRFLKSFTLELKSEQHWDRYLPLAARILNSVPHTVTKVAPAQLLYGSAIDLNRDLLANAYTQSVSTDSAPQQAGKLFVDQLITVQRKLMRAALACQRAYLRTQMLPNAHLPPTHYPVGSQVLVSYPNRPPTKLSTKFFGPCIVNSVSGNRYQLKDILNNTTFDVSVDRLQPYYHDPTKSATEVATWDSQEFFVEKILDHRLGKTKTRHEFLIKWLGYSSDYCTWEPYRHVKDLAVLTQYASEHGLRL